MELVRFPSRGGFSVRSTILFCLTVLMTVILWALLGGSPVHAASDATWTGDVILYQNQAFQTPTDTLDPSHGLAAGTSIYLHIPTVSGSTTNAKTAYFIYFAPGTDPPTATSAEYVAYDYNGKTFSNPHDKKTLSLQLKGTESGVTSSCSVSGGLGWVICPLSNTLAEAMDRIFTIVAWFIRVQPLSVQLGAENSMYTAWNFSRGIANVAFVIAFLVIIYSQLTSFGVSNYGLKKLIPRLIVAAVLVNASFYIAAAAIDLSNVLGYSIQDIFTLIREQVFHVTDATVGNTLTQTWTTVTAAMLSGGGLVMGGMYAASSGGWWLLLPLLLGLAATLIVVVIILAARQAIIVILVILAPLAFVANLLPNTEKLFTKWKDLFITMLVFFPAFSVVFGGAQLAGQIIIQNANGDLIMVVFGMAVQVAPLAITPLLLRFSGGLLGKIGQMVNDPKKGFIDRNRNWAKARQSLTRDSNVARLEAGKQRRRLNPLRISDAMVRSGDQRRRRLKTRGDTAKQWADNAYENSAKYMPLHTEAEVAAQAKKRIDNTNSAHLEGVKIAPGTRLHSAALRSEISGDQLKTAQNTTTAYYNTQRINSTSGLYQSALDLDASSARLETSENRVKAHLLRQRTLAGGALRHVVEPLEMSKTNLQGAESSYAALIDSMKSTPGSAMSDAAFAAQSAKESAEQAQTRLQAHFDARRQVVGSELNISLHETETTKLVAEAAKANVATYLQNEKLMTGSDLHTQTIRTEQAKLAQQVADTRVNKMVDEYKSGHLVRTGELSTLMNAMVDDVSQLAAETRGIQSAQNVQKENVANDLTIDRSGVATQRTEDLLTAAASVDPNGRIRAQANASAQLGSIIKEARDNNVSLIRDRAEAEGVNYVEWARNLYKRHVGYTDKTGTHPPEPQDLGMLEASVEVLASNADIATLRDAFTNTNFQEESMLLSAVARNDSTLKAKGGFDLQQKLGKLWNTNQQQMDVSIAGTIGSVNPENIASQQWGWWNDLGNNLGRIIQNVDTYGDGIDTSTPEGLEEKAQAEVDKDFSTKSLERMYISMTRALRDPNTLRTIGADKLDATLKIHQQLHGKFGASYAARGMNMEVDPDQVRSAQL